MTMRAHWFFDLLRYNFYVSPYDARDPLDGFEPTQITRRQMPCGCERLSVLQKQGTLCSHLLRQVQKLHQGTTLWGDFLTYCPTLVPHED
jgi:hypothetical protein